MKHAGDPAHSFDHTAEAINEQVFSMEGISGCERIIGWQEALLL